MFSYIDKREVLQQEYSQPTILPSPHFRWVVKKKKETSPKSVLHLHDFMWRSLSNQEVASHNILYFVSWLGVLQAIYSWSSYCVYSIQTLYRVCGLAVMAGIAVKFGTTHGRSRPAVGGAKCIGSYGRKGVPPAPSIFGTCQQNMITPTELLRPIYNFYVLTIYI